MPTVAEDRATRCLAQREFTAPLVVEAGAGTGKTALLVARVAAWCMGEGWTRHATEDRTGEEVARRVIERVSAITFTEAAAAEMARKIGEAFSRLAQDDDPVGWCPDENDLPKEPAERMARAGLLADEVHRLGVSTIHAFCQRLLSAYPFEAGLHPRFVVDAEEEQIGSLVTDVVEEALRSLADNPSRRDWEVLAENGVDPPQIAETLQYLVTNGMVASDLEREPFTDDRARVEADELAAAIREFESAGGGRLGGVAKRSKNSVVAFDAITDLAARLESLGDPPSFSELARLAAGFGTTALERLEKWAGGTFNTSERACLADAEGATASASAVVFKSIERLAVLRPVELASARRVLTPLLDEVERRRTALGVVSFGDLLHRAARLVETSPGTVREVCAGIDQLLVDEFQDTDAVQCRLIEHLAFGEHSRPGLFVVGDPKQSIYTWRNADLAAYRRFVATVEHNGGSLHPLVQNFRSVEPILDEVGKVVEAVMVEEDDVQPPFVRLAPTGERVGATGFHGGGRKAVEYWVTWPPDADGRSPAPAASGVTTAFEARAVAEDIASLGREEGVRWGDIAILLRATTAQEDLLEAFRRLGIPYEVAREREFYKQREVVEAAALVRCVIDPADPLALLNVVRSDVVGVPDAALAPLWDAGFLGAMARLQGDGPDALETVASCVALAVNNTPAEPPGTALMAEWPVSLIGAVRIIATLREAFAHEPPDRFVELIRRRWLAEVTASARFLGRFRRARLERFFTDLERRLSAGDGSTAVLARFLRQAVQDGQGGAVGGEPDLQADAVHVMTIHGAKGLDFKHVYVVQTHRESGHGRNAAEPKVLPLGEGREYRVFGWPTVDFTTAQDLKDRQTSAEMIRLLYVAMTRAKDRLVVSGGWHAEPVGKDPLHARSFADLLSSRVDSSSLEEQITTGTNRRIETGDRALWVVPAFGVDFGDDDRGEVDPDPGLLDYAGVLRDAAVLEAARVAAAERMARSLTGGASSLAHATFDRHEEEEPATSRSGPDRDAATAIGSLVHRVLEKADLGPGLSERLPAALEEASAELDLTLDESTAAAAREWLSSLTRTVAEGSCVTTLSALAPRIVGREVAIIAPPERDHGPVGAVTGFVDLVYRDPIDNRVVVADYKTDHLEGDEAITERTVVYEPQVRIYARALRDALDLDHEPHVELWFLAADRIVRL